MTKTEENGPSKEREENVPAWGLLTAASVKVYNLQICESEDLQVKCGDNLQVECGDYLQVECGDNLQVECGDNLQVECGENTQTSNIGRNVTL